MSFLRPRNRLDTHEVSNQPPPFEDVNLFTSDVAFQAAHTLLGVISVFVLAYYLVRRVMVRAAERQRVEPDRISFVDALRWLRHAEPGEELPRLNVNPDRPGRLEPRARKRRPKQYDLLNKPRAVLRRKLLQGSPGEKRAA